MSQIPLSQIPMSLILRVAVTGAGHLGSRPTDKQTAKHADTAVFEVSADSNASAGATAQDHGAATCTNLPAVTPAMNAISPLVSSSQHYKIAAEFLKAGIPYLHEKYLLEKYLREHYPDKIHPRKTSVIKRMGATTDLPATNMILHLIGGPVERLVFNDKLPLANKVNRASINTEPGDTENHRYTRLKTSFGNSDFSLEYQSGLPSFMRCGQHQPVQPVNAAIRNCA